MTVARNDFKPCPDFRLVDWEEFNMALAEQLNRLELLKCI